MINADSAIVLQGLPEIIPECELVALPGMQGAEGIDVAKTEVCPILIPEAPVVSSRVTL